MVKMTVSEFISRLAHRLWSTNEILLLVRPAGKPLDESLYKPCPGEFRPVTEENIADCEQFQDPVHNTKTFKPLLERGDYGQYGYLNGKCVYCGWLKNQSTIEHEGCLVRVIGERDRYDHFEFCDPLARGQGFQAAGCRHFVLSCPTCTYYALVAPENIASLKNFRRNGYEIYSHITVKCRLLRREMIELPIDFADKEQSWYKYIG